MSNVLDPNIRVLRSVASLLSVEFVPRIIRPMQEIPYWLRMAESLAAIATPILIAVGGFFAWYKFIRQGQHDPRLQATAVGTATVHEDTVYLIVTVRAQNTGQVDVDLDLDSSGLQVLTTKTGDEGWRRRYAGDVFLNHGAVQPGETIEDQLWFEVPYDGEAGIKLDLTVTPKENLSYLTTEIISLLPEGGESRYEGGRS